MGSRSVARIDAFSLIVGCLALVGCGGPTLYPVTGTVTLDGKPLKGAAVAFAPEAPGPVGNGVTDAEGKYLLQTVNDPGVYAGKYRVGVVLQAPGKWVGDPEGTTGGAPPGTPPPKFITPERYATPATSGLTAEVSPGHLQFDFALVTSPDLAK